MTEPVRKAVSGTVARTVRILRFIGERKLTTIREASAALMLAPSTVHRLFDLLAREGMIEQDKSERSYRAGAEFFRIAAQVVGRYDLRTIALPIMREVVANFERPVMLYSIGKDSSVMLHLARKAFFPAPSAEARQ